MAALVFIAYSIGVHLYRTSCFFVQSGGSFTKCVNYIKEIRQEILTTRYLENIEEIYDIRTDCINHSHGIECISCKTFKILEKMSWECSEIEGFIDIERAEEAFEIISKNAINDSHTKLISDNGFAFNNETPVDAKPGTSFHISGTILNNCEGFAINLTYGHSHKDIALHVNPRLPQNYIVRNSKINGYWGREEVTSSLPFSLKRGHAFVIQILVTETNYLISVNGLHFTLYAHRAPYQRVTCLQVTGDVTDVRVEQLPVHEYPEKTPEIIKTIPIVKTVVDTGSLKRGTELVMPFYGKLMAKLDYGSRLHILGRVKVLPHSFYVNLQHGEMIWPHPTIAFHLNPRFTTIGGKHVIVKNSWLDGKWDREERCEIHTDFMPSRSFHMIIESGESSYHVYLNDKLIAEYKFRLPPDIVDTVYIHGDIKLKHVSQEIHAEKNLNSI